MTDNGSPAQNDSEIVTITVGNVNQPPVLAPIGAKTVNEGQHGDGDRSRWWHAELCRCQRQRRRYVSADDGASRKSGAGWGLFTDATYTAATATNATITSPANGSTLAGSSATFTWGPGGGALEYWLTVGTTGAGSSNVYSNSQALNTSVTVFNLPAGRRPRVRPALHALRRCLGAVHRRHLHGGDRYQRRYHQSGERQHLAGTSATFTWSPGGGALEYWLVVGTTGAGSTNIYSDSQARIPPAPCSTCRWAARPSTSGSTRASALLAVHRLHLHGGAMSSAASTSAWR